MYPGFDTCTNIGAPGHSLARGVAQLYQKSDITWIHLAVKRMAPFRARKPRLHVVVARFYAEDNTAVAIEFGHKSRCRQGSQGPTWTLPDLNAELKVSPWSTRATVITTQVHVVATTS
jgi:hypothetical protein